MSEETEETVARNLEEIEGRNSTIYAARLRAQSRKTRIGVFLFAWWLIGIIVWIPVASHLTGPSARSAAEPLVSNPVVKFLIAALLAFFALGAAGGSLVIFLLLAPIIVPFVMIMALAETSPVAAFLVSVAIAGGVWYMRELLAAEFWRFVDSPVGEAVFSVASGLLGRRTNEEPTTGTWGDERVSPEAEPGTAENGDVMKEEFVQQQDQALRRQADLLRQHVGDVIPVLPSDAAGRADWLKLVKQKLVLNAEVRRNEAAIAVLDQIDRALEKTIAIRKKYDQIERFDDEEERERIRVKRELAEEREHLEQVEERRRAAKRPKTQLDIANDILNELIGSLPAGEVRADLASTADQFVLLKAVETIEERLGTEALDNPNVRTLLTARGIPIDTLRPGRTR
jgi:hypothetical protein